MFGRLRRSLRKSGELRRISRVLGREPSYEDFVARLEGGDDDREAALEKLLDLCETDPDLQKVLRPSDWDRENLKAAYWALMANGAGQWVRGHFVAVSTLVFVPTLTFFINSMREESSLRDVAFALVDYFEEGQVGLVEAEKEDWNLL